MKRYKQLFQESSIDSQMKRIVDLYQRLIGKYPLKKVVDAIATEIGISKNEVLMVLQQSEDNDK